MKILLSLFFILSSFAYAGNYMSKTKLLDCESSGRVTYFKVLDCSKSALDCVEIPKDFQCETFSDQGVLEDDLANPNYSKSQVETCVDNDDCIAKTGLKTCTDVDEGVVWTSSPFEVYCTKFLSYPQITVMHVLIDSAKLPAWNALLAKKAAMKQIFKMRKAGQSVIDVMVYRSAIKSLTIGQKKQILLTYSDIKELLEVGNLEQAKIEIQAVTPDGVLVTADDKTELIAEIDKYL